MVKKYMKTMLCLMKPILYSFRRCPYAMRARMALAYAGTDFEHREILLQHKPKALIQASAKGTVPVLVIGNGVVIDESLDIMYWALSQHDPEHWLTPDNTQTLRLLQEHDHIFKPLLDKYKYAVRFPDHSEIEYRQQGEIFLTMLEEKLSKHAFLIGNQATLVDYAIFPFIRQFANVNADWFATAPYPSLRTWLNHFLSSSLFQKIMQKKALWQATD